MSTETRESDQAGVPVSGFDLDARLMEIEEQLRKQGREAKQTRQAYGLFALIAVVIAIVNLVVIATKLDNKDSAATAGTSAPATAAPAPAPAPLGHSSAATLKEYSIAPRPSEVAAGRVAFNVHNAGSIKHEFVVLRTDKKASDLLKGNEADEAGNVGEIGNLNPGQTKTLSLNLKAGHYALICNLPGHYKLGQHADLTVR
jgi:uncharacterized cupredoxin-like copper-binding protein